MSAELPPNTELEIAHVLFMDVVGYSKLFLTNEQTALLAELNQLVRATPHFCTAEAAGKLIRIPVGDGMALLFFSTARKLPYNAHWKFARLSRSIRIFTCAWGFTAARWIRLRTSMTGQMSRAQE